MRNVAILTLGVLFSILLSKSVLCEIIQVYTENEFEQTVVDEVNEEDIQHEILSALGLPEFEKQNWTRYPLKYVCYEF